MGFFKESEGEVRIEIQRVVRFKGEQRKSGFYKSFGRNNRGGGRLIRKDFGKDGGVNNVNGIGER